MNWMHSLKQRLSSRKQPPFPYFVAVDAREMDDEELAVMKRLLKDLPAPFQSQLGALRVVGRCGCGACPTIFFQPPQAGDTEYDIATARGQDHSGGLVGAALLEKNGVLSQLEIFSVDGHDPWSIPTAQSLVPY